METGELLGKEVRVNQPSTPVEASRPSEEEEPGSSSLHTTLCHSLGVKPASAPINTALQSLSPNTHWQAA